VRGLMLAARNWAARASSAGLVWRSDRAGLEAVEVICRSVNVRG